MSRVQHPESSIPGPASTVQHPKSSVQSPVYRLQHLESSIQFLCPESRNSGMPIFWEEFRFKVLELKRVWRRPCMKLSRFYEKSIHETVLVFYMKLQYYQSLKLTKMISFGKVLHSGFLARLWEKKFSWLYEKPFTCLFLSVGSMSSFTCFFDFELIKIIKTNKNGPTISWNNNNDPMLHKQLIIQKSILYGLHIQRGKWSMKREHWTYNKLWEQYLNQPVQVIS